MENFMKVTLAKTSTGKPAVSVSIIGSNGRIYHSGPVPLAGVDFGVAVKTAQAKAQGKEEGQRELFNPITGELDLPDSGE